MLISSVLWQWAVTTDAQLALRSRSASETVRISLLLPFLARLTQPNLISALHLTLLPFPPSHLLAWTVGGIIAVFAFLAKDAPKYIPGYSICIAFIALSLIANIVYFLGVSWENRTRDCDAAKGMHINLTEEDKKRMGDLNPDYRYFT